MRHSSNVGMGNMRSLICDVRSTDLQIFRSFDLWICGSVQLKAINKQIKMATTMRVHDHNTPPGATTKCKIRVYDGNPPNDHNHHDYRDDVMPSDGTWEAKRICVCAIN